MGNSAVYEGFWYYQRLGPIFGAVWTLKASSAALLLAVSTLLIGLTAARSWKIWRFAFHSILAKLSRDVEESRRHREEQVVLCNTETASGTALSLLEITLSKSNKRTKLVRGCLILIAILHCASFISLGILITKINLGRMVIAANTPFCAVPAQLFLNESADTEYLRTFHELALNSTRSATNYVQNCYQNSREGLAECNMLETRFLPHFTESVPCPFQDSSICSLPGGEALALDSGNISIADLGVNWKYGKRVFVRRRTVCSPIRMEPFLWSADARRSYLKIVAQFGIIDDIESVRIYSHVFNETPVIYRVNEAGGYEFTARLAMNATAAVEPLRPQDPSMQVSILTLRGRRMNFDDPSFDPLFYATKRFEFGLPNSPLVWYRMERDINSIACQEMMMLCSTHTGQCSPWMGLLDFLASQSSHQMLSAHGSVQETAAVLHILYLGLTKSSMFDAVGGRGSEALEASRFVHSETQYMLTAEQWKLELSSLFNVTLAGIQMFMWRTVMDTRVDRSRITNMLSDSKNYNTKKICDMITFQSFEHVTISLFGIVIAAVLSVLLTVISHSDYLITWLSPGRAEAIFQDWNSDRSLNLLKNEKARVRTNEKFWTA